MNIANVWLSLCFCLVLCSCSKQFIQEEYLPFYKNGQLETAQDILNDQIQAEMQQDNYLSDKDAVLLLLDRATIRFVAGDTQGAIHDYQLAIEAIDYYNQTSPSEVLTQIALQDDMSAFTGEDFEQILARLYFALVLLQSGDENNALALLKQAEDVQQQKKEMYRHDLLTQDFRCIDNAVAKYLMGALLENRGDGSNAKILFEETEKLIGNTLDNLQLKKTAVANGATVIILAHNGNAPYKISGVSSGSVASLLALEIMLGHCEQPAAYSSLTGIPVPILMQQLASQRSPIFARLCRQEKNLIPLYNVTATAAAQLQQKMPLIVARGVARFIIRRGTVAYFNEKDPCLGALADMGMLVVNACTEADTRSWRTLPSSIDIARYDLPAGIHTLHLFVQWGLIPPLIDEIPIQLQPNDFCVINLFNIHPGIFSVQIPNKNKIKKEEAYEPSEFSEANISTAPNLTNSNELCL